MPRVNAWSSHDDHPDQNRPSTEPPAVIRLDPAGPPSIQQRARGASLYLTRDNPLTFIDEESDARRLASTSRWLTVDAVGVEEIKEKYGDQADELIPSTFVARSDTDVETGSGPDVDPSPERPDAESDDSGNTGADVEDFETDAGAGVKTREDLEAMSYQELRELAVDADHPDVNGRSSADAIIDALAVGADGDAPDGEDTGSD